MRILLVSPPLTDPAEPSVGVATLAAVLARQGHDAGVLYGNLLYPRLPPGETFPSRFSMFFFAPWTDGGAGRNECAEAACRLLEQREGLDIRRPETASGPTREARLRAVHRQIEAAGECAGRCAERCCDGYDVVCLSCTFEMQLVAGLAIAQRVRAARPGLPIVFGGAACFAEAAEELVRCYPCVDAVCYTEGEAVIGPLVRALGPGGGLGDVPGIVWRHATAGVTRNPPPPDVDLDSLPIPDFRDFFTQLSRSEHAGVEEPRLFFETSRGCWWGQRHPCSFCGLNAGRVRYRAKSSERVFEEIRTLWQRYPAARRLLATDNILDMGYLSTLLPSLARRSEEIAALPPSRGRCSAPERPLRLFFEVRTSLRREHAEVLAAAGVDVVQAGVESFDDELLGLMGKGATGLGQIQCIKWLHEAGIRCNYNILVRNPGETAEAYRRMIDLIPYIEHLPPPHVAPMQLERFSPYHSFPARHGLLSVRPRAYYQAIYRAPGAALDRLAYCFEYDHPTLASEPLASARLRFVDEVVAWRHLYGPGRLSFRDAPSGTLEVDDRRLVRGRAVHRVCGVARDVLLHLGRSRRESAVRTRFPGVGSAFLGCLLSTWQHRRWLARDAWGRCLVVVPRYVEPRVPPQ